MDNEASMSVIEPAAHLFGEGEGVRVKYVVCIMQNLKKNHEQSLHNQN